MGRPRLTGKTMSRRTQDMHAEQELAKFLDENLYPFLEESYKDLHWERNHDINAQLRGIDGYLHVGLDTSIVDEKATLYYINRNLPTFAFEIDSYQKGHLTPGWLFNENYETEYYMLIYPNATHDNLLKIKSTDFTETTCIFVSREKIIDYLEKQGYTKEKIEADAQRYRNRRSYGRQLISGISDFYYYLSEPNDYSETPFNVIIRRSVLEKLAKHIFVVTQNYVDIIK